LSATKTYVTMKQNPSQL